jgi:hypothetical protein
MMGSTTSEEGELSQNRGKMFSVQTLIVAALLAELGLVVESSFGGESLLSCLFWKWASICVVPPGYRNKIKPICMMQAMFNIKKCSCVQFN